MFRTGFLLAPLLLAALPAAALPDAGLGNGLALPVPALRVADSQPGFEETMWNIVKQSTSPADYEAYLEVFPNGRFADKARAALAKLRAAKTAARPDASRSIKPLPEEKLVGIGRTYIVRATANLRAAPGTDADIVGRAAAGEAVFVLGRLADRDWYKVSNRAGLVAYIAASLVGKPKLDVMPPPSPAPAPTPQPKAAETPPPAPAATPTPAAPSPEAIRADWQQKIDAVKASGPHGSCDLYVGSKWNDPVEYDLCETRNAKIKALEQEMERALAGRN